jgi:hypothetical protein
MRRRVFFVALGCALSLAHLAAGHAQERIPRIGFLSQCSRSFDKEAFKQGLRELGADEVIR